MEIPCTYSFRSNTNGFPDQLYEFSFFFSKKTLGKRDSKKKIYIYTNKRHSDIEELPRIFPELPCRCRKKKKKRVFEAPGPGNHVLYLDVSWQFSLAPGSKKRVHGPQIGETGKEIIYERSCLEKETSSEQTCRLGEKYLSQEFTKIRFGTKIKCTLATTT